MHTNRVIRYWSCLRLPEIAILQGSPLLGLVLAQQQPWLQSARTLWLLLVGNICLVAHVFLLNDWAGIATDRTDLSRAATVFTTKDVTSREVGWLSVWLLGLGLLALAALGPAPLGLAVAIAACSALYSLRQLDWKGKPLLSSVAHLGGGLLHFLLGYVTARDIDARGLMLGAFFALTFAAGHLMQEVRDYEGDTRNGIRTNAAIFGVRNTFFASVTLFTLAHGSLLLLALAGSLPRTLAALFGLYPLHLYWSLQTFRVGLSYANVCRLQARYRAIYAVIGLALLGAVVGR